MNEQMIKACIAFLSYDNNRHESMHDTLGLHRMRVGIELMTRDQLVDMLQVELLRIQSKQEPA